MNKAATGASNTPLEECAWSVRMRATDSDGRGNHLSGAERLVLESQVEEAVATVAARALRSGYNPKFLQITLDRISVRDIKSTTVLPMISIASDKTQEARSIADSVLRAAGIGDEAIARGFSLLLGDLVERPIRGAAIFDSQTGARLDYNYERGVRATRMDYAPGERAGIEATLLSGGLANFRTREAIVVATKALWSGILAEICWSDDPDYLAGYIATHQHGYVRLQSFKPRGAMGGRAFFVDPQSTPLDQCILNLEKTPLWVRGPLLLKTTTQAEALRSLP